MVLRDKCFDWLVCHSRLYLNSLWRLKRRGSLVRRYRVPTLLFDFLCFKKSSSRDAIIEVAPVSRQHSLVSQASLPLSNKEFAPSGVTCDDRHNNIDNYSRQRKYVRCGDIPRQRLVQRPPAARAREHPISCRDPDRAAKGYG